MTHSFTLDYYNKCVIQRIIDKYGMEPMDATRSFLTSQTHAMLEDTEYAMWDFSERAIGFKRFSDVLKQLEKNGVLKLEMDAQNNMLIRML